MNPAHTNNPGSEIALPDHTRYSYSVRPFEMKNALGSVIAILQEYTFTRVGEPSQSYKLYRTREGNWYEIDSVNDSPESGVRRSLKNAFDEQETFTGLSL